MTTLDRRASTRPSLLTQAYLLETYGPRLTMEQLAEVMRIKVSTLYNKIAAEELPIPTYKDGKRFADYRDVAIYLDSFREATPV